MMDFELIHINTTEYFRDEPGVTVVVTIRFEPIKLHRSARAGARGWETDCATAEFVFDCCNDATPYVTLSGWPLKRASDERDSRTKNREAVRVADDGGLSEHLAQILSEDPRVVAHFPKAP